ncbi:hypothetical protein GCM10027289_03430 [Tsukamurella serpentis]
MIVGDGLGVTGRGTVVVGGCVAEVDGGGGGGVGVVVVVVAGVDGVGAGVVGSADATAGSSPSIGTIAAGITSARRIRVLRVPVCMAFSSLVTGVYVEEIGTSRGLR